MGFCLPFTPPATYFDIKEEKKGNTDLRIQLFCLDFPPRRFIGAEIYDFHLLKFLQEQGHEVSVVATNTEASWEYGGIQVNGLPAKPDIILTHLDNSSAAFMMAKVSKAKIVGIAHNTGETVKQAAKHGKYDALIFNNHSMAIEFGSRKTEKLAILIPPVPEPKKRIKKVRENITAVNMAIPKGGVVFASLAETLPAENFKAVLGGWGRQVKVDYSNLEYLEHGSDAVDNLLKDAKLFIVASESESWGMAASEAIAAGVPVIYYEHLKGVAENAGIAGIAVNAGRFMNLVEAIKGDLPSKEDCLEQARINKAKHLQGLKEVEQLLGAL